MVSPRVPRMMSGTSEKGARGLDPRAEAAKHPIGVLGNATDLLVHGNQPIQIRRPGDPPALDRGPFTARVNSARVDLVGERGPISGPAIADSMSATSRDRARDRPGDAESVPDERPRM